MNLGPRKHPSIISPFEEPPPLRPEIKMGRNEPCWCGSGTKWKNCHRNRHLQKSIKIGRRLHEMHNLFQEDFCSHPDANADTCGKPIRAHTIQRRGGLSSIAENGHVISFKAGLQNIPKNKGKIVPSEVGLKDAATFRGFCDKHDLEMFRPIEKGGVILNKEAAFLLSFRALAYERFTKLAAIRALPIMRDADRGTSFENQCATQKFLYYYGIGVRGGLRDTEEWKTEFDRAYRNQDYGDFGFLCLILEDSMPVVASGAIFPDFDFSGNELQKISRGRVRLEILSFNLTILGGQSVAVFGWKDSEYETIKVFVDSFLLLKDENKPDALVRFAYEFIENTFCDPRWWRQLSDEDRDAIAKRVHSGTTAAPPRQPECLLPDGQIKVGPRKVLSNFVL